MERKGAVAIKCDKVLSDATNNGLYVRVIFDMFFAESRQNFPRRSRYIVRKEKSTTFNLQNLV